LTWALSQEGATETVNNREWRRSTGCESSNCVEWRELDQHVEVRNSTNPDGPVLRFSREEWAVFVDGLVAEAEPGGLSL
jgi:hypothetical protein